MIASNFKILTPMTMSYSGEISCQLTGWMKTWPSTVTRLLLQSHPCKCHNMSVRLNTVIYGNVDRT